MHESYTTFMLICFLLTITPGADTALVLKSSLGGPRKSFVMTTLGICAGLLFHATMSSLGLSAILQKSSQLYHLIKLLGAGYLIYLGARALFEVHSHGTTEEDLDAPQSDRADFSAFAEFRNGLLTNILNPKVAVFYLTFLPQFVNVQGHVLIQSILLSTVHIAMSFVWLCLIGSFVAYFRTQLTKPLFKTAIQSITGLALIGFGMRLAMSKA
ncbi:MAG TPA: LysE family translocator [Oligoflexus sp.]|uniref:LysE family translocator n=1 Tax=Oligoflexus sp. TaxID=1971216 RepID=UPI002D80AE5A|nr:LysE family translocator [Oligoflexus sp.]HET9239952.1 LysE family translocator [Oligoflexus sp.]